MRRTSLLVFALLAAGCVTPPPADPIVGPDGMPPAPTYLRYADCDELLGAFPVQPDAVVLPEGFEAEPFAGSSGPATIFIVGWSCASVRAGDATNGSEPFVEAFVGFNVRPPEAWRSENATYHALFMGLTTGSPVAAAAYRAWGIPVEEESPTFDWQATPLGGSGELSGAAGPLDIGMRVNAGGPPSPETPGLVRVFVLDGDEVGSAYDIAWTDGEGFTGQSTSTEPLPGAPPATLGLGFYYTSDEERYLVTPYELAELHETA